jgi:hypothetical protein
MAKLSLQHTDEDPDNHGAIAPNVRFPPAIIEKQNSPRLSGNISMKAALRFFIGGSLKGSSTSGASG